MEDRSNDIRRGCGAFLVAFCIVGFLVVLMCGCRTAKVIEQEKIVYRDSVRVVDRYARDSVFFHDSTIIKEKGDTLFIERIKTAYKEKIVKNTDTIYVDAVKTNTQTQTITKNVTPKWCWWLLIICVILILMKIVSLYLRKR